MYQSRTLLLIGSCCEPFWLAGATAWQAGMIRCPVLHILAEHDVASSAQAEGSFYGCASSFTAYTQEQAAHSNAGGLSLPLLAVPGQLEQDGGRADLAETNSHDLTKGRHDVSRNVSLAQASAYYDADDHRDALSHAPPHPRECDGVCRECSPHAARPARDPYSSHGGSQMMMDDVSGFSPKGISLSRSRR